MFEQTKKIIELNRKFEEAVMAKDLNTVRELFADDKGNDEMPFLNFEMVTSTAIMIAAQNADWDMVEELYNFGADLDVKIMPHKWYLINECISHAPDRITKGIIDYANVNVQNNKGETPVMIAIKRQKGIMAEYLVESGRLDLSLVTDNFENAAHIAAREKNYDLFLKLIAKGVPLLRKNKDGKTPVDLIEDETFRLTLPLELEKISDNGGHIVLEDEKKENEISLSDNEKKEQVKKVTGLSSIKKKIS